jgi:hypothetical protein
MLGKRSKSVFRTREFEEIASSQRAAVQQPGDRGWTAGTVTKLPMPRQVIHQHRAHRPYPDRYSRIIRQERRRMVIA